MMESDEEFVESDKFDEVKDSFHKHTESLFNDYANTFEDHLEKELKYRIPSVIYEKVNDMRRDGSGHIGSWLWHWSSWEIA